MKKVMFFLICVIILSGCLKKPDDRVKYRYTIDYTDGVVKGSASRFCYDECPAAPPKIVVDEVMCDISGNFYVSGLENYLKQENFKCKVTLTKEGDSK